MIKISLDLYTPWELDIISEGMGIILAAREAQKTTSTGGALPAVVTEVQPVVEPQVIATITPTGVTKPEPPPAKGPSLADVEAAAHAHILKHGLPATRALVESYGGNQIKKVDEAKWPAMLAQLVGEVGE